MATTSDGPIPTETGTETADAAKLKPPPPLPGAGWKRRKRAAAGAGVGGLINGLDDGCLMHIFSLLSPIPDLDTICLDGQNMHTFPESIVYKDAMMFTVVRGAYVLWTFYFSW